MLDLSHEAELNEQVWHVLPSRTQLPADIRDLLGKHGNEGVMVDCQRRYTRIPLHKIAIAVYGEIRHACFAKDISRMGIGFYAPVNFMPKKAFRLWLPNGNVLQLSVARCRRVAAQCYEVGAIYNSEPAKNSE